MEFIAFGALSVTAFIFACIGLGVTLNWLVPAIASWPPYLVGPGLLVLAIGSIMLAGWFYKRVSR